AYRSRLGSIRAPGARRRLSGTGPADPAHIDLTHSPVTRGNLTPSAGGFIVPANLDATPAWPTAERSQATRAEIIRGGWDEGWIAVCRLRHAHHGAGGSLRALSGSALQGPRDDDH